MAFQRDMSLDLSKPVRGTFRTQLHDKRTAAATHERKVKAESKARDKNKCRWPGCKRRLTLHSAHLEHKGSGGDIRQIRTTRDKLITFCAWCHGQFDLKNIGVEPLTPLGTDGPVSFYSRTESGRMEHVASERLIGISEARR